MNRAPASRPATSSQAPRPLLRWGLILTAAVLLAAASVKLPIAARLLQALEWIRQLGPWAPLAFIGTYVLATVLFLPCWILTVGAGVLFGLLPGSIWSSLGATLGATLAFLIGRYLARSWVSHRLQNSPRFQAIDQAIGREGWKIVGLLRLSPIFPFVALNYAFSLTRVPLLPYVVASWMGMIPGTLLYVYIGSLAGSLAELTAGDRTRAPAEWILFGVGLAATLGVTLYLTRLARRTLAQHLPHPSPHEPDPPSLGRT